MKNRFRWSAMMGLLIIVLNSCAIPTPIHIAPTVPLEISITPIQITATPNRPATTTAPIETTPGPAPLGCHTPSGSTLISYQNNPPALITQPFMSPTPLTPTPSPRLATSILSPANVAQMEPLDVIWPGPEYSSDMAFMPDSQRILVADSTGIAMWDIATGQVVRQMEGQSNAFHVATSADGTLIATGGDPQNSTVRLRDAASGSLIWAAPPGRDLVSSLAFSPNGTQLASGTRGNLVQVWDTRSGQLLSELAGPSGKLLDVFWRLYWLDDSTLLAGGSNAVYWWNIPAKEMVARLVAPASDDFFVGMAWHDGVVATVAQNKQVTLWDAYTQVIKKPLPPIAQSILFTVDISPDGQLAAAGADDGSLWVWDLLNSKLLAECSGQTGSLTTVRFSPDGRYLATLSADQTIWLWGMP
jgi:WD40 repeat protein